MNRRRILLTPLMAGLAASALLLSAVRADVAGPNEFKLGMTAYNLGHFIEAARVWSGLAKQGSGNAQSGLGLLYYTGRGVPRDFHRAHNLFLAAAKQSVPEALMFLSLMYRRGDGVPQSHLVSYMWCDIAVGFGHEAAIYVRQTIAEHLTEDSILMAQKMSSEWRNNTFK